MPTVSFYTDQNTKAKLEHLAEKDHRSLSNYLTLLINDHWALKNAAKQPPIDPGVSHEIETKIDPERLDTTGTPAPSAA